MTEEVGGDLLRSEVVDRIVHQVAERSYKFKQSLLISTTNGWKESFYRETMAELTEPNGNAVKGLPRGANFPQASVSWDKVSTYIEKYGLEDNIFWEDILTNDIDVMARTIAKVTERVAKAVDDEIYDVIINTTGIQTVTITAAYEWDATSAAVLDNIFEAAQEIAEYNYSTENLHCHVSPKDKRSIMTWITNKGSQFNNLSEEIARNGKFIRLGGVTFIENNSIPASYALVVVPQTCGRWRASVPLTSTLVDDPYKSKKIRVVEMGVTEITDPKACVLISNTQA